MEPDETEETVTCNRCRKLLRQPVELPCYHCACMSCVKSIITESGALTCPQCSVQHAIKLSSVRPPSQLLVQLFGRINVRCSLCQCQILAKNAERHIQSGCEKYTLTTLESIMERPTNVPLTAAEKKVGDHIVRRMVGNTTQPVQVSTRGPVSLVNLHVCSYILIYSLIMRYFLRNSLDSPLSTASEYHEGHNTKTWNFFSHNATKGARSSQVP